MAWEFVFEVVIRGHVGRTSHSDKGKEWGHKKVALIDRAQAGHFCH